MTARKRHYMSKIEDFEMTSISQKTKLITYKLDNMTHTSIWRHKENWFLVFHQITPQGNKFSRLTAKTRTNTPGFLDA